MAAQRYKDILFSYSGLISSTEEIKQISKYFSNVQKSIAQAYTSELIDLTRYTIQRNPGRIKSILKEDQDNPFVFVACLN